MILDTLNSHPSIGMACTIGTGFLHWTGAINPILSFISMLIGITVGITTLYLQIIKIRKCQKGNGWKIIG